jgi:hypothetical protein
MKYLATGLVVSVTVAIAVPASAQTPMMPPQHSGHHGMTRHHRGPSYSQNHMANRLNAEELDSLRAGSPIYRMPSGGKQLTSDR